MISLYADSLLAYLHTNPMQKRKTDEILNGWIQQLDSVPQFELLPMLINMIEKFKTSSLSSSLLDKCYEQTFDLAKGKEN